jgi:ABC-type transport system involved in Fe-S cluster assembly fused permease/ATPase subunit
MNYKELSKKEKINLQMKYYNTPRGRKLLPILNRLVIEGVFLLICVPVILVCIFLFKLAWWYYLVLVTCIVAGITFLVVQNNIRMKEYNKTLNDKSIMNKKKK